MPLLVLCLWDFPSVPFTWRRIKIDVKVRIWGQHDADKKIGIGEMEKSQVRGREDAHSIV